jgi:hypothetical protein
MADIRLSRKQAALMAISKDKGLQYRIGDKYPDLFKVSSQLDKYVMYQTRNGTKIIVTLFKWSLPKGDWNPIGKIGRYYVYYQ